MKFILNTAVDPHFCALFDKAGALQDLATWDNPRHDGQQCFNFLQKHKDAELKFIGGCTGPGGFSSLRAGAGVLNALAYAKNLPIYQIRADVWIARLCGDENFVLNSFGKRVWTMQNHALTHTDTTQAASDHPTAWAGLLPPDKQKGFQNTTPEAPEKLATTLLQTLGTTQPKKDFSPEYEYPPV